MSSVSKRRPLEQKAQHDQDKAAVLRMAHRGRGAGRGDLVVVLGPIEDIPGGRQQNKATGDHQVAQEM